MFVLDKMVLPPPNEGQTSFVPDAIVVLALVLYELRTVLINCIIS